MSRRTKFIVLIIVVLLALAVVLWVIFALRGALRGGEDTASLRNGVASGGAAVEANGAIVSVRRAGLEPGAEAAVSGAVISLEALARSFAERYGSYSNQSNFENLEDLYPFMTARFREQEQARVAQARVGVSESDAYEGVDTKVVSIAARLRTDSGAQFEIGTQRRKQSREGTQTFYQSVNLMLVREGEMWKVDGVEWK